MALFYKTFGRKSSPPILMFHGFLGSHADWNLVAKELSKNYYCIAVDLPGHGKSPIVQRKITSAFDDLTDQVCELLDELRFEKVTLLGYSMGGFEALVLGATGLDKVAQLTSFDRIVVNPYQVE